MSPEKVNTWKSKVTCNMNKYYAYIFHHFRITNLYFFKEKTINVHCLDGYVIAAKLVIVAVFNKLLILYYKLVDFYLIFAMITEIVMSKCTLIKLALFGIECSFK